MIVDNQDSLFGAALQLNPTAGTEQITPVHPLLFGTTASVPPSIPARYCMIRNPIPLFFAAFRGKPTPLSLTRREIRSGSQSSSIVTSLALPCLNALET